MNPKTISSLSHPLVKYCIKLKEDSALRKKEKKVFLQGSHLLYELAPFITVDTLFITSSAPTKIHAKQTCIVTDEIMQKICKATNNPSVAAIAEMPQEKDVSKASHLLVLDSIADPGNLGTLLRTAQALGGDGVFLLGSCCDLFNDKALRAAKGATFRLPFQHGDMKVLQSILQAKQRAIYIADMKGQNYLHAPKGKDCALILSSEAHGARDELKEKLQSICIPMPGQMESLNVAIAGGILLAHLWGKP
jgi:TrmH family RNA methyltransferase